MKFIPGAEQIARFAPLGYSLIQICGEGKMSLVGRRVIPAILPVFLWLSLGFEASAAPIGLTVMTQNLYVGADTDPVLRNPTPEVIAAAFQSVVANNFPARAAAIAAEAASAGGPLLIGLQEASIITAPTGTLDYTQILIGALEAQGLHYNAIVHPGFFFALGGFSVRDQDVVLARTDVPGFAVSSSEQHTFVNNVVSPSPLGPFSLDNGYVLVNASLDGTPFQFVSTHLDPFHTPLQPLQAGEILAALGMSAEPQLVVGDFNARPEELTYGEMLAAGFTDVALLAGAAGLTCCQSPDLDNPVSELTNRYDYIFERGFASIDGALLVGDTPFENVRPLWTSDHAGLIGAVGVISAVNVSEPSAAALFASALLLLGILQLRRRGQGAARVYCAAASPASFSCRLSASISAAFFSTSSTRWSTMSAFLRRWSVRPLR
jgi:endonuclease/exonuclease/phosphatase family metal-dependent hydrolase